ncbi:MAG: glucokinase [Pseudomonadota bacterium]
MTTALLADVGGTNTRVALGRGGQLDTGTIRWFRNEDYCDFAAVLAAYDATGAARMSVAIAGPVTGEQARLTNRDWVIDAGAWDMPVKLCNDLQAVGHGLDDLPPGALAEVAAGHPTQGAQRLVIGLGTGFNVSLVAGQEVLQAEHGHASLPVAVADWVTARVGKMPFASVEALFSGRGVEEFHRLSTGTSLPSDQIVAGAPDTLALFGEAVGILTTQLVYHYLPLGGIVLNGGLARAVIRTKEGLHGFARGYVMHDALGARLAGIPVHLVTDDAAALYGCARLARL